MTYFKKKANVFVMTVAGLSLIVAAALKSHQLLTEPILSKGFWESWLFFVIQIPLELGLGIWLVSGLFRKAAWTLGTLAFALFICETFYKGITGEVSCGCFGRVTVNPWITLFAIDIPIFLAMVIFRPRDCKFFPPPWPSWQHFFAIAMPTAIVISALVPTLYFNKQLTEPEKWDLINKLRGEVKSNGSSNGESDGTGDPNAVEAKLWPMLKHIDIADKLTSGLVVVMLHRHTCSECEVAVPRYDQMYRDLGGENGPFRLAFIEVPPYGEKGQGHVPADTPALVGKLDESKDWAVTSPQVVLLLNGVLVKYWPGGEAPDLEELLKAISEDQ